MKIFENPKAKLRTKYGEYQIAVLGNIVAVSAEGIADKNAIARYGRDMMEVVSNFQGERWAFLGYLHGQALLTGDGERELAKSVAWRAQRGMAQGALITGQTTIETLVKSQFERVYQEAGVTLGIFSDEASALVWLSENGFHSD